MPRDKLFMAKVAAVSGLLICGTGTAITAKTQFEVYSLDQNHHCRPFMVPWMETMIMFVGMGSCAVLHFGSLIWDRCKKKGGAARSPSRGPNGMPSAVLSPGYGSSLPVRSPDAKGGAAQPLLDNVADNDAAEGGGGEEAAAGGVDWKLILVIAVPTIFDLIATTLAGIGLLWTSVSVYQMLRGALMAFGALFSICFLKKKLKKFHWVGLALNICALAVVGTASVFDPATSHQSGTVVSTGYQILGIGLIVLGQAVQAAQFVVEEKLMADMSAPPLLIVGMEGVWGFLFMVPLLAIVNSTDAGQLFKSCVNPEPHHPHVCRPVTSGVHHLPASPYNLGCEGLPIVDTSQKSHLYHEEFETTMTLMHNSRTIKVLVVVYIFAILGLNVAGMNVTRLMSAVTRTVFEACRTLCIWIFALFMFYALKWHGEKWTKWSFMQAAGFILLVLGTFVYNEILRLPCIDYDDDDDGNKTDSDQNDDYDRSDADADFEGLGAMTAQRRNSEPGTYDALDDYGAAYCESMDYGSFAT